MATKTVINCLEHNMAQTNKGISIIIDPQAGYDKTMNTTNIIQIKHSNEQQQYMTKATTTTTKTTTTLLTLNDNIIGNGKANNTTKTLIDIKRPNNTEDVASNDHLSLGNYEVKQQHILQIDCCNNNAQISPIAKEILESNHEEHLTEQIRGNEQHQQLHHHNDDVNVSTKERLKLANSEEKEEDENDKADCELNENSSVKPQVKQQFNLTLATKEEEDDDEESGQTASQQQQKQQEQQQQKYKEKEHYGAVQQSCFEQVEENGNGNSNSKTRENGQSRSINEITKQKLLLTDYGQNESHDDNEDRDNNVRNNNETQDHNEQIHREGNHNNDGDHNETNCMDSSGVSSSSSGNGISIGSDCITQVKREVADDFSHGKRSLYEENSNSLLTQADALTTTNTKSSKTLLTINTAPLTLTNLNFKQNIQENSTEKKNNHVVKIQIKPNNSNNNDNNNILTEPQITVVKIENPQKSESIENFNNNNNNNQNNNTNSASENIENEQKLEKGNEAVNMVQKPSNNAANAATVTVTNVNNATLNLNVSNTPTSNVNANGNGNGTLTASSTTVTELNMSNPQYLYYMMSSGQFSPCDTLDSGTGSDLESNGQQNQDSNSMQTKKSSCSLSSSSTASTNSLAPLEMQLKNAKARLGNGKNNNSNLEIQQRQCSFTDSEESEASSLSCDSLHSSEFLRQSSTSPTPLKNSNSSNNSKKIKSLLPDSLLREIKNLKFSSTDYEAENEAEDDDPKISPEPADYIKSHEFIQSRKNLSNLPLNISSSLKRASLPSKTFVLNTEDGTFIDTKMNSMPRTYEADKYYNFHVNEHDNFRSFGSNSANGGDSFSISDFETKSLHDDVFAGYRDIRCGSNTSTIRSSKGTVRGVKNRVRNGIATFLQLQQPNIKVSHIQK
ncbi:hypothetical protein DOY81_004960 [Sarcophaga bullata]|nr:hypothetical protein DOY81_004960 [Sarcophaga bullata]